MSKNIIIDKSYQFAVEIVKLSRHLALSEREYIISKQLLKSGTSIGANVQEAQDAESKADFIHKLKISLKECRETIYWLRLLHDTEILNSEKVHDLKNEAEELKAILIAIVKSTRKNQSS